MKFAEVRGDKLHSKDEKEQEENNEKTKIEIRGMFTDWKEVNPEQAREYVKTLKRRITNLNDTEKNKYINSKRLRGATVEELEKCAK